MSQEESGNIFAIFGGNAFNPEDYRAPVHPPGKVRVLIKKSQLKTTKKGDGKYVWVEMQVVESGKFDGFMLWDQFNIINPNPQAEEISRNRLANLAEACGIKELNDTSEFTNKCVIATVKVEDGRNTISKYSSTQNQNNQIEFQQKGEMNEKDSEENNKPPWQR